MINNIISFFLSVCLSLGGVPPRLLAENTVTATVPVTVGAQQAVYEKWSVTTTSYKGYQLVFRTASSSSAVFTGSWDYSFNRRTGEITLDDTVSINKEQDCTFFAYIGIGDISRIVQNWDEATKTLYQRAFPGTVSSATITEEVKDTFIADITADANSLPSDGKHTDGYWYVFKNLVED